MNLIRTIKKNGNLDTDLFNLLSSIPDNMLFYKEHPGLRHPLGIYNIASSKVYGSFSKALNSYGEYLSVRGESHRLKNNSQLNKEANQKQEILHQNYKNLLYALAEFIDSTYIILQCFYPKNACKSKEKFVYKWLSNIDSKTCNIYYNKIKEYRDELFLIVNKLKHSNARISELLASADYQKGICCYFIEGINASGAMSPDCEIHKRYNGSITAISFNRDFKYHFISYYFVSHYLKTTIEYMINKKYGIKIKILPQGDKIGPVNLICELQNLPELFFVNEYNKKVPKICINNDKTELSLYFGQKMNCPYKALGVQINYTGDGISKQFAF